MTGPDLPIFRIYSYFHYTNTGQLISPKEFPVIFQTRAQKRSKVTS